MLRDLLRREGYMIGRKRVRAVMVRLGIEALYRKPTTSQRHPAHPVYPYRVRDLTITRSNQVWAADITYIPMKQTWLRVPVCGHGLGESSGVGLAALQYADH
jgi:putative transposase